MEYSLKINNIVVINQEVEISLSGELIDKNINNEFLVEPKVILHFDNGIEDRRIPFVIETDNIVLSDGKCVFFGTYTYYLDLIFWKTRKQKLPFDMYFNMSFSDFYEEKINIELNEAKQDKKYFEVEVASNHYSFKSTRRRNNNILQRILRILKFLFLFIQIPYFEIIYFIKRIVLKKSDDENIIAKKIHKKMKEYLIQIKYKFNKDKKIQPNKITFYSARSDEMQSNIKFVYDKIKDDKTLDIRFLSCTKLIKDMNNKDINELLDACATSKVIILDEYTPQIHLINLKPQTKLIQLWHACGAFKTFGFSRLKKTEGPKQSGKNNRSYDYAIVSSEFCKKFHSEAFGISTNNVIATGIPRTDVFFDEEHKEKVRNDFYNKYTHLKNKKVILFAPTFRGVLKEDAYYPMELFDIKEICENLGNEYAIIIKHHPYIKEKHYIPEEYVDRVIDLSADMNINDLLFVTDIVVTDYSSLVFEASILNLPMIFYAYDLKEYMETRDFYFDYKRDTPGKICYNLQSVIDTIKNEDYNLERVIQFRDIFFDNLDGKSSERVVKLLYKALKS